LITPPHPGTQPFGDCSTPLQSLRLMGLMATVVEEGISPGAGLDKGGCGEHPSSWEPVERPRLQEPGYSASARDSAPIIPARSLPSSVEDTWLSHYGRTAGTRDFNPQHPAAISASAKRLTESRYLGVRLPLSPLSHNTLLKRTFTCKTTHHGLQ